MRKKFLLVFLFQLLLWPLIGQEALNTFLDMPELKSASVGVLVVNSATNDTLLCHNPYKSLQPASILKLVTTSTALEMLQPNFKFGTKIYASSPPSGNGTLYGKLIVKAAGDPSFASKYFNISPQMVFDVMYQIMKQNNINKIDGGIEINTSIFDNQVIPPGWIWEDMGNYYAPGSHAMAWRDNTFEIHMKSHAIGKPVEIIDVVPEIKGLEIENHVVAAGNKKDSAYVYGAPFSTHQFITGTIPAFRDDFTIKAAMPDPAQQFGNELFEYLNKKGVEVNNIFISNQILPENAKLIKTLYSPSLHEIVEFTNKQSVNLYAEYLLKHLALRTAHTANRENGIKILRDYWRKRQLDVSALRIADGSGLSPKNLVSPDFMVAMLDYMRNKSHYNQSFLNSLPIAGKDGTLKSFMKSTKLENRVFAKSGSMNGIRCYAGYIHAPSNEVYTFCIMVNHFNGETQNVVNGIERLLLESL